MSSWAKPGVKCVCVKSGGWSDGAPGEITPVEGQVLTIRTVEFVGIGVGLTFVEIVNRPQGHVEGYFECCFLSVHFRPLVSQDDDVMLFVHHLNRVGEPA